MKIAFLIDTLFRVGGGNSATIAEHALQIKKLLVEQTIVSVKLG